MNQRDTSADAQRVLIEIYRNMPITDKVTRIFDACRMGKMLKMAGLRQLHPDASEDQIWQLWAKQHLGEKLYNEVYGALTDQQLQNLWQE